MTESRAKELLSKLGMKYESEPSWITSGRRPDFYCSEPTECWCEVKSLDRPEESKRIGEAFEELRKRTAGLSVPGLGIAHVGEVMSHGNARLAVALLQRAAKRLTESDAPDAVVALVPKSFQPNSFVRFSYSTRDQNQVEFHSCVSDTGRYAVPSGMYPEPDSQTITLKFSSGRTKEVSAHAVLETSDDFRVAKAVHPHEADFEIVSAVPTGGARRLDNIERIREVVRDANDQCKYANLYKQAPSVTIVFHDGLDVPDDTIVKSALYGNLYYVAPKTDPAGGKLILEGDGAWNSTKNRTTSAVMYVRNGVEPVIVHNHWAERPLPAGLFGCREISVTNGGSFQEADYSSKPGPTKAA